MVRVGVLQRECVFYGYFDAPLMYWLMGLQRHHKLMDILYEDYIRSPRRRQTQQPRDATIMAAAVLNLYLKE